MNFAEWVTVTALSTVKKIIAQVTNRVFVGDPLCELQVTNSGMLHVLKILICDRSQSGISEYRYKVR